jgi:hypothetical protein
MELYSDHYPRILWRHERAATSSGNATRTGHSESTALGGSDILQDREDGHGVSPMPKTLYMVVEHFKNKDAVSVYRRFRDSGRMAPEGLLYVSSWVDENLERCYQLMETHDRRLLDEWMAKWSDLVEFEVHPVVTSKEAAEKIWPLL